jgi:transcriptional regulator with XRE-family HTH domain
MSHTRARSKRAKARLRAGSHALVEDAAGQRALEVLVAEQVRKLRSEHGLSVTDLSAASGVSHSWISQIERLRTNPTLNVLWNVALALDVPFESLFGEAPKPSVLILRAGDRATARDAGRAMVSRLLHSEATVAIDIRETTLVNQDVLQRKAEPEGTKKVLVVAAGSVRVTVGLGEYDLVEGDSISFQAAAPCAYENRGSAQARFIEIIRKISSC